jgi:hypothetical protein
LNNGVELVRENTINKRDRIGSWTDLPENGSLDKIQSIMGWVNVVNRKRGGDDT